MGCGWGCPSPLYTSPRDIGAIQKKALLTNNKIFNKNERKQMGGDFFWYFFFFFWYFFMFFVVPWSPGLLLPRFAGPLHSLLIEFF